MRKIAALALALLLLLVPCLSASAANRVDSMKIQAVIDKDGSMRITQTWDVHFQEGTESYIPLRTSDELVLSDLRVADQNGVYEVLDHWDVDASFEEKANKCGVRAVEGGSEVCFGISQYGENRYAIEYKLQNAVRGHSDRDGANVRFVNDRMNTGPTDATIEIHLWDGTPLTEANCVIWAFGFEGQVFFEDGAIRAYTQQPLTAENHMTILFGLEKGILTPSKTENDSFETVKQAAFEGSDYSAEGDDDSSLLWELAFLAICGLLAFGTVVLCKKLKKKQRKTKLERFSRRFGYFRRLPNGGDLCASYTLGRLFELCEDGAILATGMLRLIDLGCLVSEHQEEVGFMGGTKETVNLRLAGSNHAEMDEYDEYLYTVLEGAAGADGLLQAKELERFAEENDRLLRNYISKYDFAGRAVLNQKHALKRWEIPAKLSSLTPVGQQELGELMGFRKYLEDFSLVAERGVQELPLWKELLSYAMLFGIADKVALQMKELYPNLEAEITGYSQSVFTACSYQYLLYQNMRQAEDDRREAARSGGSGGFASFGGGGGSIGGGSGGGTR